MFHGKPRNDFRRAGRATTKIQIFNERDKKVTLAFAAFASKVFADDEGSHLLIHTWLKPGVTNSVFKGNPFKRQ
jgi:hypothetical protein